MSSLTNAFRTEGADDLQRIANALKAEADKGLQKRVSAAIRQEAKPLGQRVLERGADEMPRRGGFSDRVKREGRVLISNSLRGRVASVEVKIRNKGKRYNLLDKGQLRHPVYGNRKVWRTQSVPANAFTDAFNEEAPKVRQAVLNAAQDALSDIARKA